MNQEISNSNLDIKTKIGYAAGHICNDITSSLLASYSLVFYQNILKIDKSLVGIIILIGQLADGFTSSTVGFLSDLHLNFWLCNKYGRRKVILKRKLSLKVKPNYM